MKGDVDDYYIGDDMKLRQVMINILGNTVKFTPPGGSVTFAVEAIARFNGRSTLRFIISDTGIGMSRDFLPKLFNAFSQEDSSSTSRFGSTGLGMAITRSIIELMNGTISVESIPVIALTANAFDEDVQHSMQAGLNAHLSKPVEPDILFETLEGLLQ